MSGLLVLIGWTFEIERPKQLGGNIWMTANIAVGLKAAGASLLAGPPAGGFGFKGAVLALRSNRLTIVLEG